MNNENILVKIDDFKLRCGVMVREREGGLVAILKFVLAFRKESEYYQGTILCWNERDDFDLCISDVHILAERFCCGLFLISIGQFSFLER